MKDDRGIYYYPFPQNHQVRMYVREAENTLWFRLWSEADPALWEDHGWLPWEAVRQAMALRTPKDFDAKRAYDPEVARAVLDSENGKTGDSGS
jgi:hypothetical protein